MSRKLILIIITVSFSLKLYAQFTVPYRIKDKWGIADTAGNMKVPCTYDSIHDNSSWINFQAEYICYKKGKQGLITIVDTRAYSLDWKDTTKKHFLIFTIEPDYDSIRTGYQFNIAYKDNHVAVYNKYGVLLFPLKENINADSVNAVYVQTPITSDGWKSDVTGWNTKTEGTVSEKELQKLVDDNQRRFEKDSSVVRYGDELIFYDNHYYRNNFSKDDSWQQKPVITEVRFYKKMKYTFRKFTNLSSNDRSVFRTSKKINDGNWYDSIDISPAFIKTEFKNISSSFDTVGTGYSSGILDKPYQWYKSAVKVSPTATIKILKNIYPAFGVLIDSEKTGLVSMSWKNDDATEKTSWVCYPESLPYYDSLIATQDGHASGTEHSPSFYFKKDDSISVICDGAVRAGPLKINSGEDIKYIDHGIFLVHTRDINFPIRLYNKNVLFNPGISNYSFDLIWTNSVVIIHNKDVLQLYEVLNSYYDNQFAKKLEFPNATFVFFKNRYYDYKNIGRSPEGGYLGKGNHYRATLIVQQANGKNDFYMKQDESGEWKLVYSVDRLLQTKYPFFKIEKDGKAGYIDETGREFFQN